MASLKLNFVLVTTIVVAYTHFPTTMAATSWVVGGSYGWTLPSKPKFYDEWTKGKKFAKNDKFWFEFEDHKHTVSEVEKEVYDTCNTTNIKIDLDMSGVIYILYEAKVYYFVCKFHCKEGHKVILDAKES